MKKIKNLSLQTISITFFDKGKEVNFSLKPKKEIQVPNSYSSIIVNNLIKRRILSCKVVEEPKIVIEAPQSKKSKENVINKSLNSFDSNPK
jgi:hypothetical protein